MIEILLDSKIAIIGGGRFCKIFLEYLYDKNFMDRSPTLLGVADINPHHDFEASLSKTTVASLPSSASPSAGAVEN